MNDDVVVEDAVFPQAGVAARRWRRFEIELRAWLETPEGRFAVFLAEHDRLHDLSLSA